MKKLFVVDAAGYLYRSYFAIRNMTNDKGESTNALFGFVRSIHKLIKDFQPADCAIIFEGEDNSRSRTTLFKDYKAHRSAMPPDLLYQIHWAEQFCHLLGLPLLSVNHVEADDTMASIATWAAGNGFTTYLCTSDKDLCQLVSESIYLLDTFKENRVMDVQAVQEKFGVPPLLIGDLLALTGDSSDNVPGVPGIGPKTAAELLQKWGSLDTILNGTIESSKKIELIRKHREEVLLSRALVTLNLDVEFPREESFFKVKPVQKEALKNFYVSMKFNSLLKELDQLEPKDPLASNHLYHTVDDPEALHTLIRILENSPLICIDTETTGIDPMQAELVGIGFAVQSEEAWYIPCNGKLGKEEVLKQLKPLLSDPKHLFFGHNLKYDEHVLTNAGIPLAKIGFDTILASYLLNTHSRRHSLDELSLEYFGFVKTTTSSLIGKGKNQITMLDVPIEKVSAYCCEDVDYTVRLHRILEKELQTRGLQELYETLELPLMHVLAEMEQAGIYLDVPQLERFGVELNRDLAILSEEIYLLAGEAFNLNSPLQLSKILFTKLGIPAPKGLSTNAEVLDKLKWEYPIAGKIQEYRGLEKLRSTYVEVLPGQVNPRTGRIHCTFNQSVTATGRLSCQDPNLQNIPVRSEIGLRIREAFRPQKEGWSYIGADYSQIELRLLAHLSEDPVLIEAFEKKEDIHRHTASIVFQTPLEKVTKEMRDRAKAVNFGIIYGQGAYGLSQNLGIPQKEAAKFIEMYFHQYPKVKGFLEGCKDRARITGKAITLTGRERALPEILSSNIQIRNAAERLAVNTPFQGSAADLIKMAMLQIQAAIKKQALTGFMILQIHDELIFEVPDEELVSFKPLIKNTMEHVISLKVPLLVDVAIGKNWKEC